MPRFSVAFGRRKSTADNLENAAVNGSSFRVLERSEVVGAKPFDGGVRLSATAHALHRPTTSDVTIDDNIFADLKPNRGSGSSNTTKTTLTDNSSRHSNASTAPSSADTGGSDEWRGAQKRPTMDIPVPPIPKSSSAGFLKAAGRTFSFGGQKKHLPTAPTIDESPPQTPAAAEVQTPGNGRPRAPTSSTTTTVTPPRVDSEFDLDLGGDFGKMLLGNDKRASVATPRTDHYSGHTAAPRTLTGARPAQLAPIQIDKTTRVDPPPHSWSSQHSDDQLIVSSSPSASPRIKDQTAPPVPPHLSPVLERRRLGTSREAEPTRPLLAAQRVNSEQEDGEDEEARLLKDSLSTVTRFIQGAGSLPADLSSGAGYRRNEGSGGDDDGVLDSAHGYSPKHGSRYSSRQPTGAPWSQKIMTPAEFERYRKDKERQDREREITTTGGRGGGDEDEDEEDNYEDDEDDAEKAKQQAKQRRKQEAHMAVYRQQMMKVTGESAGTASSSRPSLQMSFSAPNLPNAATPGPSSGATNTSENSDEDEEIPLAILAAHGFPNKARPPNRLSTMGSNPNLRASQQLGYQRPGSVIGEAPGSGNPHLPAFARNLPKDPFIGAGLVRNAVRESFALGGGAPAPVQGGGAVPPGGLIGVIANEERNRALRRGSPHLDGPSSLPGPGPAGFDPVAGIPPHMLYPTHANPPALSPGDHAQIQMTQQMQHFMQMQMQFMQMMAGQNGNTPPPLAGGLMPSQSAGNLSAMGGLSPGMGMLGARGPEVRHSFVGNDSMLDAPFGRGETQLRTMSMVQPSSASWIQPAQPAGYAPSIRVQSGAYAPSIAPSERSNIGLPGRYRPVSHVPPAAPSHLQKSSTMSGAIHHASMSVTKSGNASDDDDEKGWEAMKAKREKKKSLWRSKKSGGDDVGALTS